ncbi:MAG: CpXC domain-containing protein [Gaiellaceae bacterium]
MSITDLRKIPCRACGEEVLAVTIESANPSRHPPFQEQLLDRELLKMPCPHCDAEHRHYDRFTWIDLPGRLCVVVVHESERPDWPELETEARRELSVPLRDEGPRFVREFGDTVAIRLVFGLEELREKVVCRIHDLDDRVVEAMKEDLVYGATLDAAEPGMNLTFTDGEERSFDVGWHVFEETGARTDELAADLPGIFDPRATWVNTGRSRRAPLREDVAPPLPRA